MEQDSRERILHGGLTYVVPRKEHSIFTTKDTKDEEKKQHTEKADRSVIHK